MATHQRPLRMIATVKFQKLVQQIYSRHDDRQQPTPTSKFETNLKRLPWFGSFRTIMHTAHCKISEFWQMQILKDIMYITPPKNTKKNINLTLISPKSRFTQGAWQVSNTKLPNQIRPKLKALENPYQPPNELTLCTPCFPSVKARVPKATPSSNM